MWGESLAEPMAERIIVRQDKNFRPCFWPQVQKNPRLSIMKQSKIFTY